jgi:hypothetical protein
LSKYLQRALSSIDSGNGQPFAPHGVKIALIGALSLIVKIPITPDLGHVDEAVRSGQTETKTAAENLMRAINGPKTDCDNTNTTAQQTMVKVEQIMDMALEANAAAKEATEIGKATMKMIRDMKSASQHGLPNTALTYASIVARGGLASSMHNPQDERASSV